MRIRGRIVITGNDAPELGARITRSLEPDNLTNITTSYGEDNVAICLWSDKIGSLIATVDDYLMNARIAADVIATVDDKKKRG